MRLRTVLRSSKRLEMCNVKGHEQKTINCNNNNSNAKRRHATPIATNDITNTNINNIVSLEGQSLLFQLTGDFRCGIRFFVFCFRSGRRVSFFFFVFSSRLSCVSFFSALSLLLVTQIWVHIDRHSSPLTSTAYLRTWCLFPPRVRAISK